MPSVPDWLPFLPGASYWVPSPRLRSHGLAQLVDKLAKPLSEEETMSMSTVRGWPSSAYFIKVLTPITISTTSPQFLNCPKASSMSTSAC
ncbi:hypothetical protein D8674_010174 [Pyrus ussuriensis x Pyrus communis]|uniref:Uncharacterized protein n=1 Tax=Pyrus ussuriensis x Pyrus communis TaxID=2448454 RepID=A0A5N5FAR1_9ROSA|nr:hypothetical protein D8674_010174 [Pyrus ussuriensis x Pyrus communis]